MIDDSSSQDIEGYRINDMQTKLDFHVDKLVFFINCVLNFVKIFKLQICVKLCLKLLVFNSQSKNKYFEFVSLMEFIQKKNKKCYLLMNTYGF